MATIKYNLDNKTDKNGLSAVRMVISHRTKTVYWFTMVRVLPSQWDEKQSKVVAHPNRQAYNNYLQHELLEAQARLLNISMSTNMKTLTALQVKDAILSKTTSRVGGVNFETYYKKIANTKHESTMAGYMNVLAAIKKDYPSFAAFTFDDITRDFVRDWIGKMRQRGIKESTIISYVQKVSSVFNEAIEEGVTESYPFRRLKLKADATRHRVLTPEQLRTMWAHKIALTPRMRHCVDMFFLIFFLIGINISDLADLKPAINGRVDYRRKKTRRLYSIFVEPEAEELIEKHKGEGTAVNFREKLSKKTTPSSYMSALLKQSIRRLNKCCESGLPEGITTYWARHSWATIAASLDIPKETISAALGHEIGNKVTSIYIDFDRKKIDEANRRVIDWVMYGKK